MGNSTVKNTTSANLFSIVNTTLVEAVKVDPYVGDNGIVVTEEIQPVLKDGKRQYSVNNNIRLTCDTDPNFVFPEQLKLTTLRKLVKGTQVQLTDRNYVIQRNSRSGKVSETRRPKDGSGKLKGFSSLVYQPEYVRPAGKTCTDIG